MSVDFNRQAFCEAALRRTTAAVMQLLDRSDDPVAPPSLDDVIADRQRRWPATRIPPAPGPGAGGAGARSRTRTPMPDPTWRWRASCIA